MASSYFSSQTDMSVVFDGFCTNRKHVRKFCVKNGHMYQHLASISIWSALEAAGDTSRIEENTAISFRHFLRLMFAKHGKQQNPLKQGLENTV